MALRKIVVEGDPVLKKKSRPVEKFDARLAELLDDMRQTLYSAEGVGLAAVQVGVLRRVVVVDVGDGLLELVNPEIIEAEGESARARDVYPCLENMGKPFARQSSRSRRRIGRANGVSIRAMD